LGLIGICSYELKEVIMLNIALVADEPDAKYKHTFEVIHISKNKKFTFSASSEEEKVDWVATLNELINPHLEQGFKKSKEVGSLLVSEGRRALPPIPPIGYSESMLRFKCSLQDVRYVELPKADPKYEELVSAIRRKFGILRVSISAPIGNATVELVSQVCCCQASRRQLVIADRV
jgi:hypothetical protein